MIGKRLAVALAVAWLGTGLAFVPSVVSAQTACKCRLKVKDCKTHHRDFFNCKAQTGPDKRACKKAQKAAIKADCHGCTKPCSSPSGAFLD